MEKDIALKIENVSKQYRLGLTGTGTISHDLNRWWHKVRGKEDPYSTVGVVNDRSVVGGDYVWAIKDINIEVKQGEVLGIIGKNGAGKSTLLKILSRITGPTTGKISMNGRMASLLEVGTGFHPELTGRENIFLNGAILGMSQKEIRDKLDDIVGFSGCAKYVDTPVKRYSSGMRVRLGFAVAAFLEPDILVVDEVLAVGDAEFQKQAIGKMKEVSSQGGRTVLFVSHNMTSVKTLCDTGIILDKGLITYKGTANDAVDIYLDSKEGLVSCKNYVNDPDQPKTDTVDLLEFKLCDSKEKVVESFNLYENVFVEITYRVKSLNGDCYPNILFFDSKGEYFFVEAISSLDTPKSKGIFRTRFFIPSNTFNVGRYSTGIAITSYPGTNVHFHVNPGLVFEVLEEDLSFRGTPLTGKMPGVSRFKLHNETIKID